MHRAGGGGAGCGGRGGGGGPCWSRNVLSDSVVLVGTHCKSQVYFIKCCGQLKG